MKPQGRPIGRHIRELCAQVQAVGNATVAELPRRVGGSKKYLDRAVEYGYLTCEGGVYFPVEGLAQRLTPTAKRITERKAPPPKVIAPARSISSVFQLGAQA